MPESVEEFYARVLAATDEHGRLPILDNQMPGWDIFPYESDTLRLKPLQPLCDREPDRKGEDPAECSCRHGLPSSRDERVIWSNDRWSLMALEGGIPIVAILMPHSHHDLADLPADLGAELGQLTVAIAAAVEALPSVGRCHVARYGDGGAHFHLFFFGRPARVGQFRGSTLVDWEENLPRLPAEVAADNARFVAETIVTAYGGVVVPTSEEPAADR